MEVRRTRIKSKPSGDTVTGPSGNGEDLPSGITEDTSQDADTPSSEGDTPEASVVIEEIKSQENITYKIGAANGSDDVIIQVPVPSDDSVPSGPVEDSPVVNGNNSGDQNDGASPGPTINASGEGVDTIDTSGESSPPSGNDNVIMAAEGSEEPMPHEDEDDADEENDAAAPDVPQDNKTCIVDDKKDGKDPEEKAVTEKNEIKEDDEDDVMNGSEEKKTPGSGGRRSRGTTRKQRELANLVIDTPQKETPDTEPEGPRSRFGRVMKIKTPHSTKSTPAKKSGDPETTTGTKIDGQKPDANGLVTPRRPGRPPLIKTSDTPGVPKTPSVPMTPAKITQVPERKLVVFPTEDRIVCSRSQLLTIPPKIAEFGVGDIIWSKVTGYPFWPCMISIDPLRNIYTEKDKSGEEDVYHVQYFGAEATRNWTKPKNYIAFNGLEAFKSLTEPKAATPAGNKRASAKKTNNRYFVEPRHKKAWLQAVAEAEFALDMSHEDRVQNFTFEYRQSSASNRPKEKKKELTGTPSGPRPAKRAKVSSSPEDIYDFNEDEFDEPEEVASSPLRLLSQKKKGDFNVYVSREKENLRKSYPKLSEDELTSLLERNWSYLSEDQKLKYVVRTGGDDTPTQNLKVKQLSNQVKPRTPLSLIKKKVVATPVQKAPAKLKDDDEPDSSLIIDEKPAKSPKTPVRKIQTPAATPVVAAVSTEKKKRGRKRKSETLDSEPELKVKRKSSVGDVKQQQKPENDPSSTVDQISDEMLVESEDASSISESSVTVKFQEVCMKCYEKIEESSDGILCSGACLQYYHQKCIDGLKPESVEGWKCAECTSGIHSCSICSTPDESVEKCSDEKCGHYYHRACLKKSYPHKENKDGGFTCPLHFCLTCHNQHDEDNVYRCIKKKLVTCIKCPTAYHMLDDCVAAGSVVVIPNSRVICPEHQEKKRREKHINVSFCLACLKGGQLICCERCPAAFHVDCLEFTPPDQKDFFCSSCIKRKQLNYGDIVWVKLGAYRWWPGKITLPKETPDNVMHKEWSTGQFPVLFFGSKDYNFSDRSRTFRYEEDDATSKPLTAGSSSKIDKLFRTACAEAKVAFEQFKTARNESLKSKSSKYAPYVKILKNCPYGNVQEKDSESNETHNKCECDPKSDAACSSDADCLNRLMMFECNASNCGAGENCQNQRFRKRDYIKSKPINTGTRGWGLITEQDVKKGSFVIEYVGELIDEHECNRRLEEKVQKNDKNFYFLTIDKDRIIDAGPKGNFARFMNHSCQPNCETQKWVVNGVTKVGLFAIHDIPAGTELTFNYNLDCRGNEKTVCGCGARNCSNFIGVRPKALPEDANSKKAKENGTTGGGGRKRNRGTTGDQVGADNQPQRKSNRRDPRKSFASSHEDECFFCGEGGELIMCDRRACPKSYHLNCLKLKALPKGRWDCPHHHCDDCGKPSSQFCHFCPCSYCSQHLQSNFKQRPGTDEIVCPEHHDDDIEDHASPAKK